MLGTVLFLDLLVGIWLHLHAPQWITWFLTHIPVLGLAAAAWGIASDEGKDRFRAAVQRLLQHRRSSQGLVAIAGAFVLFTAFCSSVQVRALDSGVRTRLRLVDGRPSRDELPALRSAPSRIFNHLTNPVTFSVAILPIGRRMWVYDGRLASAPHLVAPWVPTRLTYPDDFDTLATLMVLPPPQMTGELQNFTPTLTIRDGHDTSIVLASAQLSRGLAFGFPDVSRGDSADARLRAKAAAYHLKDARERDSTAAGASSANVAVTMQLWTPAEVVLTRRPLVVNDLLRWELRKQNGRTITDTIRIAHATEYLFLAP